MIDNLCSKGHDLVTPPDGETVCSKCGLVMDHFQSKICFVDLHQSSANLSYANLSRFQRIINDVCASSPNINLLKPRLERKISTAVSLNVTQGVRSEDLIVAAIYVICEELKRRHRRDREISSIILEDLRSWAESKNVALSKKHFGPLVTGFRRLGSQIFLSKRSLSLNREQWTLSQIKRWSSHCLRLRR
jgi:hypothetical protein